MDATSIARIRANPRFAELERRRNGFSWMLAAVMVSIYGAFILLVAYAPGLMAMRIGGGVITLGFPLGLAVIVSAVTLTAVYVWRANSEFDELTRSLQESGR